MCHWHIPRCVSLSLSLSPPLHPLMCPLTEQEVEEEMEPFSEDGLAQLYSNPQLESNPTFVDNFIMVGAASRHNRSMLECFWHEGTAWSVVRVVRTY